MEDSIKEDFFFSNPNDTIDSDGLEDNNGVDFAINTIFSNTNHKTDTKTNENLYHISSNSVSKENATEVPSCISVDFIRTGRKGPRRNQKIYPRQSLCLECLVPPWMGFEMRLTGQNPRFARFSGIRTDRLVKIFPFAASFFSFLCLMFANFECPDIFNSPYFMYLLISSYVY